jgi:hypothetical protein
MTTLNAFKSVLTTRWSIALQYVTQHKVPINTLSCNQHFHFNSPLFRTTSDLSLSAEMRLLRIIDPGVDVMITSYCDFRQFSAKQLAFFSKTNVMIKILHNLACFESKMHFFAEFFGENIKKIITSVPGLPDYS